MPAVKSGALPITGPMSLSCPALAILAVLPRQLRAQPEGKALVGHQPRELLSQLQPGKSWARGASTALGSCSAWGLAQAQSHELQGDVFSIGQESTRDVSHESDGKESPEPEGCLPTAPLQPKWKNTQPHPCLLRP